MYYKLTDTAMRTHEDFQWELGKWYSIPKKNRGGKLCSVSWFHCYNDPLLAALLNPIHADIESPRLFACETRGDMATDRGLKFGFTEMRITEEMPVPEISTTQKVAFGILCAKQVYKDPDWNYWADNWLSREDRTELAAWAAEAAAGAAAEAAKAAAEAAKAAEAADIDLIALANEAMEY